jgi:hypothetical protein
MTPTIPSPEAEVPEVHPHPTPVAAGDPALPEFVTTGVVLDGERIGCGLPIQLYVGHGASWSFLDGEVMEYCEDEATAVVWGLSDSDPRLKGLWQAVVALDEINGQEWWVLVSLRRAPGPEPEVIEGEGHAGAIATGPQTLVVPDLPGTAGPPPAKRRFSDDQRAARAAKLREQMHAAIDRGEEPQGPKADWVRESAAHVLALLEEIADEYDAEHDDDTVIDGDILDILATARGYLREGMPDQ